MILCLDIGNTNISFALCDEESIVLKFDIPTSSIIKNKKRLHFIILKKIKKSKAKDLKTAIVCSVVPQALKIIKDIFRKKFDFKIIEMGKNLKVPIKNKYRYPKKVGQDRLVNAYAAIQLYGKPAVVVDFGTCITFDCISKKGEYLGGLILPGIKMSLDSLYKKTALLPKLKMSLPKNFIGKDTKESIRSGLYHGFLGASQLIIKSLKKELGSKTLIVATGGYAKLFTKEKNIFNFYNLNLTLQGLDLIYKEKLRKIIKK